jgi:hypothetical protein
MSDFSIPAAKNTPAIQFRSQTGTLSFKGKSFPENARKYFDEVGAYFRSYNFASDFYTDLDLDYMSSSSVICILDLIKRLKKQAPGTTFHVRFYYDENDDDMQAVGENYSKILGKEFTLIPK